MLFPPGVIGLPNVLNPPPSAPIPVVPLKSGMGHDDQFPPPRLGARYRFNQRTFVATRGNERDAPIADLPALTPGTGWFDPNRSFTKRADFGPS